jgi:hypothetical protein
MRVGLAALACLALALGACQGGRTAASPTATLPVTDLSSVKLPTPTPSPTPTSASSVPPSATATPIELTPTDTPNVPTAPPTAPASTTTATPLASQVALATPTADCVNGWVTPAEGSDQWNTALDMMETEMAVSGPWTVDEMRYFTGPDVPWIIEPHYDVVQYWYVKASRADDPSFSARWLLEQRTDQIRGISAIAPSTTVGYTSPDWMWFVGDGAPVIYTGLPGEWAGVPYDFVTGEGDSGNPGLPDEVVGCLSGT